MGQHVANTFPPRWLQTLTSVEVLGLITYVIIIDSIETKYEAQTLVLALVAFLSISLGLDKLNKGGD
jgi:hypothetical protein